MSKPAYVWDGSQWVAIGAPIPESPISYQSSAPASATTGDIWVDSDDNKFYVYSASSWNNVDGMTDEEIAQREADIAAAAAQKAHEDQVMAAREEALASAKAKLTKLGLTDAEISALRNELIEL